MSFLNLCQNPLVGGSLRDSVVASLSASPPRTIQDWTIELPPPLLHAHAFYSTEIARVRST